MKPSPKLDLVQWADTHRYLSPESSSTPGKWSTDLVEAARGPMLAVTEPGIKKITVMAATQLLKTELLNNIVAYFIHQDPAPMIVMQPIEKLANTWATDRLDPMLRDTPALRGLVRDKRERDSGNTKLHKAFPGGHVTVVSAGSPSDVASRPVRVVLMDEIDKYKQSGDEGDAEKLIEQRTETFWNALSIAVCSPTNEGTSKIAARFEDSDKRFFNFLCPDCNQYELPKWQQVKWSGNDSSTAHYECSHCKVQWTETKRLQAISNGVYIATAPFKGHAGFQVSALASPWQPLSRLVEKFIEAKSDPEKLKVFVNTSLAETWKPKVDLPDWERLYDRRETYTIGTVPNTDIKFLTCGVDVQADRLEAQVVGWTKDKQSYVIDYRILVGPTHTDEPWNELYKLIQDTTYPVAGTKRSMSITFACVDSGFNTTKVYDFVTRFSANKVRTVKGSDSLISHYKMGSDIEYRFDGSKNKFAHKVWMVGSSLIKTETYSHLRLPSETDGLYPSGYIHTPEFDQDYFKGFCSEALVKSKSGYEWVKQRERNEVLDTYVYARCAASMFGIDRFRENEWQQLEGQADDTAASTTVSVKPPIAPASSPLWRNPGLKRRSF